MPWLTDQNGRKSRQPCKLTTITTGALPNTTNKNSLRCCAWSAFNRGSVWQKRPALLEAYQGFDPAKVAQFGEEEVAKLLADPALIRNQLKVRATINNARILSQWHQEGRTLEQFTWSFTNGRSIRMEPVPGLPLPAKTPLSEQVATEFKRAGFKFTGPVVVMSYLTAVGVINARLA